MISNVEYFQETVKEVYVIWQGEEKKLLFLSPERPVVITTVKKKSRLLANLFPPCNISVTWHSVWFTKKSKKPSSTVAFRLDKERLFLFSLKPVVGRVTKNSWCCFGRYITLFTATHMLCSFWCKGEHQKILEIWSWVQHSIKHTFQWSLCLHNFFGFLQQKYQA